jgi:phage terminase small subunit
MPTGQANIVGMSNDMQEIADKLGIDPDSDEALAIETAISNDFFGGEW